MEAVPAILGVRPFQELTFQSWKVLRLCLLRATTGNLLLTHKLPKPLPTRAVLAGQFHHKVMELAAKASGKTDLADGIERQIGLLQALVDASPHLRRSGAVSGWDEVNESAMMAMTALRDSSGRRGAEAGVERLLKSRDSLLAGKPDFFRIAEKSGYIREYKAGTLRDRSGQVKEEYRDQVLFYAALLYENFDLKDVTATLESGRGEHYQVKIEKSQATDFMRRIRTEIAGANSRIAAASTASSLATTSSDACSFCTKTIICDAFKVAQASLTLMDDRRVVEGDLERLAIESDAKACVTTLRERPSKALLSLTIPAYLASGLRVGHAYIFADLAGAANGVRWAPRSRIIACG